MKKHLIAAAVVAAVTAPAMAQNVTVYGAIDVGVASLNDGALRTTAEINDLLRTSRIGVRGSEDLGGGLKAEFQLQGAFTPQGVTQDSVNSGTGTQSSAQGFNFGEEAWVGVSGGFGHIRLGTTDVTGLNGLDSTVGQSGNAFNSTSLGGEVGNNLSDTVRYISPKINGFQLDAAYRFGQNKDATAKDSQPAVTAFLLSYGNGPLNVYLGSAQADAKAGAAAVTERTYDALGATYDAGVAKFGLLYSRADSAATNSKEYKQTILSAVVPVGKGLNVHAGYLNLDAPSQTGATGYSVALVKSLSKRTDIYAAYSKVDNETSGTNRWSMTGQIKDTRVATGQDPSAFGIGISHSF